MTNEVAALQAAIDNTADRINSALDQHDPRAFKQWCRKRASLIGRLESLLLSLATAPVA